MFPDEMPKFESRGHVWKMDEDGETDTCAFSWEFHSGPICKNCLYEFCILYEKGPQCDCPNVERI